MRDSAASPPSSRAHSFHPAAVAEARGRKRDLVAEEDAASAAGASPRTIATGGLSTSKHVRRSNPSSPPVAPAPTRRKRLNLELGSITKGRMIAGLARCSHAACGAIEEHERQFGVCSACAAATYCSSECQEAHWRAGHRVACSSRSPAGGLWLRSSSSSSSAAAAAAAAAGEAAPPPLMHAPPALAITPSPPVTPIAVASPNHYLNLVPARRHSMGSPPPRAPLLQQHQQQPSARSRMSVSSVVAARGAVVVGSPVRDCASPALSAELPLPPPYIRAVMFDMDRTILSVHTKGCYTGSLDDLASHVSPVFLAVVPRLLDRGVHVAVVTFSDEMMVKAHSIGVAGEPLVRGVTERAFSRHFAEAGAPDAAARARAVVARLLVAAAYPKLRNERAGRADEMMPRTKLWHIDQVRAALHAQGHAVERHEMLILDDSRDNVRTAGESGVHAFAVDGRMALTGGQWVHAMERLEAAQ